MYQIISFSLWARLNTFFSCSVLIRSFLVFFFVDENNEVNKETAERIIEEIHL